jgi:cyclopropane-fatty-acyl-phospholipid synthase
MWEMYLLGCEMVFTVQDITVLQLQITRQIDTLPITRNYMIEVEQALALSDVGTGSSSIKQVEETVEEDLEAAS